MRSSFNEPNRLLARARSRLKSPSGSGRELSRQELAEAVNAYLWQTYRIITNLDATYIGHLEQGRHRWPSALRREAFRHVLAMDSDATIGFYITRSARRPASRADDTDEHLDGEVNRRTLLTPIAVAALPTGPRAKAAELIMALTSFGAGEADVRAAAPEGQDLAKRVAAVRNSYQHGRYSAALERLPGLLADLHDPTSPDPSGPHHCTLMAEAYQGASGLLLKTDDTALASIAADRSITNARRSGDPLTMASSVRAVVHTLLASGYCAQASQLAVSAAERLERESDPDSAETRSLYGALVLRGAIAAARSENRQLTEALLTEATGVAATIRDDGNAQWTAFSPTNVQLHRVAAAIHLGDAGLAIHLAERIDVRQIALPERKATLLIDTARAYTQWGKYEKALSAIQSADRHAPEEVRTRRPVIGLIAAIAQSSPAPIQRRARTYARTIGVAL